MAKVEQAMVASFTGLSARGKAHFRKNCFFESIIASFHDQELFRMLQMAEVKILNLKHQQMERSSLCNKPRSIIVCRGKACRSSRVKLSPVPFFGRS